MKTTILDRVIQLVCLGFIVVSFYFASQSAFHGDISFSADIARDVLLVEDIVRNKPLTLIGPRSGGIPGVFHGPAWSYLQVPAFIIGNGNPAFISWFWVFLFACSLFVLFFVAKRLADASTAWMTTAFFAVATAFGVSSLFNPYGAVICTPIFFYFILQYFSQKKAKDLLLSLFTLGLITQFQIAFGGPILLLITPLILISIFRSKKFSHLLCFFILSIPFSTYILFEVKHDFLQIRSVLSYLSGKEVPGVLVYTGQRLFHERLVGMFIEDTVFVAKRNLFVILAFFGFCLFGLYKSQKDTKVRNAFLLFTYLYFGFWGVTLLYHSIVWSYYYWPFWSLLILIFVMSGKYVNKLVFFGVVCAFLLFNLRGEYLNGNKSNSYFGSNASSWLFQYKVAKDIFRDAPNEFGYYIFTADQYGYPPRYAMNYTQTRFPNKKAVPYTKKKTTYLIIAKNNDPDNSYDWWRSHKVNIAKKPVKTFTYESDYIVEKYELTDEELKIPSDPNLIQTLIFR